MIQVVVTNRLPRSLTSLFVSRVLFAWHAVVPKVQQSRVWAAARIQQNAVLKAQCCRCGCPISPEHRKVISLPRQFTGVRIPSDTIAECTSVAKISQLECQPRIQALRPIV